jgi:hypothetical protein
MSEIKYTALRYEHQITDEMVQMVAEVLRGWYPEGRVDWEDVWDRVDGSELDDGTRLDLGDDLTTPALKALRRRAMKAR